MKRVLDILFSCAAMVLLAPLFVVLVISVRMNFGAPIFFRQKRPGLGGRPFRLAKFRTMRNTTDADGRLVADEARLTSFGRFLRSTSLDELPELWNVLKGEMSIVGPRPLLMEYLSRYSAAQARRHEVRPGITGWAQVNGRNSLSWDEKFALDVWYVDHHSLWLDAKIVLQTIGKVLLRKDISADNHDTMPPFLGNKDVGITR